MDFLVIILVDANCLLADPDGATPELLFKAPGYVRLVLIELEGHRLTAEFRHAGEIVLRPVDKESIGEANA
jgi:hypothetical protein